MHTSIIIILQVNHLVWIMRERKGGILYSNDSGLINLRSHHTSTAVLRAFESIIHQNIFLIISENHWTPMAPSLETLNKGNVICTGNFNFKMQWLHYNESTWEYIYCCISATRWKPLARPAIIAHLHYFYVCISTASNGCIYSCSVVMTAIPEFNRPPW